MLEITTTRHNPLVDPVAFGVELGNPAVPVRRRHRRRPDDPRRHRACCAWRAAKTRSATSRCRRRCSAFMLLNVGMGALFLDLAHKLYVWAVYLTFQPASPMSWGSWVLLIVYPLLLASALIRLPEAWPWIARRLPVAGARRPPHSMAAGRERCACSPGRTSCSASHSASTPGSCCRRWSRGRCGTFRYSGRCSSSPECRPARRCCTWPWWACCRRAGRRRAG